MEVEKTDNLTSSQFRENPFGSHPGDRLRRPDFDHDMNGDEGQADT